MVSTCCLYFISSSPSLEPDLGFSSLTSTPKLVLWGPPPPSRVRWEVLSPQLATRVSTWEGMDTLFPLLERQCVPWRTLPLPCEEVIPSVGCWTPFTFWTSNRHGTPVACAYS